MSVHIPPRPPVLDSVRLHEISLPLPSAPDPWHRDGKPQPCTATLKLSYSSAIAAASSDDVSLSLDYGKLYRRLDTDVRNMGSSHGGASTDMVSIEGTQRPEMRSTAVGQDPRVTAGIVANCGLGLLDETAAAVRRMAHVHTSPRGSFSGAFAGAAQVSPAAAAPRSYPISGDYGQCEVSLHLPKAILRAEEGLKYRSLTVWGYKQGLASEEGRCPVVLEEEFRIEGIRCHCILGVNSHERVEKQTVILSLEFSGPGQLAWGSTVVDSYQAMTRAVAENVEETSFQTVEALATFVARIVTVEFGNERVTVRVEKPSALAFVQRSGVEITRTMDFFRS
ncbi:hypothetical protein N7474_009793 [Penicillium riverlandense]|uniref:uncharacterized protein n=1 Tax=Penicillium riverlandense TaxID=1903569 RepID=UPI002548DB84|nr:uncharacterized protein N7474_009793 [Penicillium riverlandense]KAJ5808524.1 hypothetical protein N7474_009793 [Penicillium riverlandense]